MEVCEVEQNEEECVRLYLEDMLQVYGYTDIRYSDTKRALIVSFSNNQVVDELLERNPSFNIEQKKYFTKKVTEEISKQDHGVTDKGAQQHVVKFRKPRKRSASQQRPRTSQNMNQPHQQEYRMQQTDMKQENTRRQQFPQQPWQMQLQQQEQEQQLQTLAGKSNGRQHQQTPQFLNHPQESSQRMQRVEQQQLQLQQQQQLQQQRKLPRAEQMQNGPLLQQRIYPQRSQQRTQDAGDPTQLDNLVIVSGIPFTTSKPSLELELTKQWKDMGIEYEHVDYNPSTGLAVVKLKTSRDVHAALQAKSGGTKWSIASYDGRQRVRDLLGDVVLLIENISTEFSTEALWCWTKVVVGDLAHTIVYSSSYKVAAAMFPYFTELNIDEVASRAKAHTVDGHRLHITAVRQTKRATASDIKERVTAEMLKDHLEDIQMGGQKGSVQNVFKTDVRTAIVTFCNEHALSHAIQEKHTLFGKEFLLVPMFSELGPITSSRQLCAFTRMKRDLDDTGTINTMPAELTVTGFDYKNIEESTLRLFLSQSRRSGGGEIRSFLCSEGKAVVTFVDSECATRVNEKYQREGLQLCGVTLTASLRTFEIRDDAHRDRLLLRNIGVASDDSLKYWLWGLSNIPVKTIHFAQKNEDSQLFALAIFERAVDFPRLFSLIKFVRLDGLLLEPDFVSLPTSILATHVPEHAHHDLVERHFVRFGNVQTVRQINKHQWIVQFFRPVDASRAHREKIIFDDGVELKTSLHLEFRVLNDARKKGKRGQLSFSLHFIDRAAVDFALAKRKEDVIRLLQPFQSEIRNDKKEEAPAVVCLLSPEEPVYQDVLQRWPTIKDACVGFFTPIKSKSVTVSANVYEAFESSERFSNISNTSQKDLLLTCRHNAHESQYEIIAAGTPVAVDEAYAAVQLLVKDISYSVERSKQFVTHVSDRLVESSLKLLDKMGFFQNMRACYNDLKMQLDLEKSVIQFEGVPADVTDSTKKMEQILSSSTEETIEASADMLTLLSKSDIREIVDDNLKQKKLSDTVVWFLKPSVGVRVRGADATSTHEAVIIIRSQVVQMSIVLDAESEHLLSSKKWDTFCCDIKKKYHNNLVLKPPTLDLYKSGSFLRVWCKATESKSIKEEIQNFLRQHTERKDFVALHRLKVKFVTKFMKESIITHIETLLSSNNVKVHPISEPTRDYEKTGFEIFGNQEGIDHAKRTLARIMKSHKVGILLHTVTTPGAEKHFRSQQTALMNIGDETKTLICVTSDAAEELEFDMADSNAQTAGQVSLPCRMVPHVLEGDKANGNLKPVGKLAYATAENVQKAQTEIVPSMTCNNVTVELVEDFLEQQKVDVIINTVGSKLRLDFGRLSKILAATAGPAMQTYLNQHFPDGLAEGKFAVSEGFLLPCKLVFHCCCSNWDNGSGKQILHDLLKACLTEAAQRGMSSIAIPAVGTGLLGFPLDESAKITYESVLEFCRIHPSSSVRLIRLVVFGSPALVEAYKEKHAASLSAEKKSISQMPLQDARAQTQETSNIVSAKQGISGAVSFSLKFAICGTEGNIVDAANAIDKYCRDKVSEYVQQDKENYWSTLSKLQVDDIVKQCLDEGVELDIDPSSRCITVRSLDSLAAKAMRLQVENTLKSHETLSRWKWQFRDDKGQWRTFEPSLNAQLELAFQGDRPSMDYKSSDGTVHVVSLRDRRSYIKGNSCVCVEVQRVDKEQGLPDGWTNKLEYMEEMVTEGSQEYDEVKASFFMTAQNTLRIIEIKRVQNLNLLKQYEAQRDTTKKNMDASSTLPVERWLWHGTDDSSLQKICMHCFNRSYCGVNGTLYGQGVYFARDSSYSARDTYSKPSVAGVKHMIYCRVLTGEFELGNSKMRTPSPRQNANKANYDTTVDDISNPSIFVTYHDAQAYPAYIVKFQ